MANFTYPSRDIDKPETLLGFLGSHWNNAYDNREQIRSLMSARGRAEAQKQIQLREAIDNVSRLKQPLYRLDQWYQIVLRESQRNDESVALLKYDDPDVDATYGPHPDTGVLYKYGVPNDLQSTFPLSHEIVDVPFIYNSFKDPVVGLTKGQDFYLSSTEDAITFRENPFNNPKLRPTDVYQNGIVVDREIKLWCFRVDTGRDWVFRQHGYVVDLELESSQAYKDYINAVWDAAVEGTATKQFDRAVAALTDTPVVREEIETVEYVVKDARHQLVITDKHAYRYSRNSTPVVNVGDTVRQGDQLVDTVTIYEFGKGEVPSQEELRSIELNRGFLVAGFAGGISFDNREVPLVVDTSGLFTRVEWELGGFAGDVAEFWEQVHERGIESPPTLAQLLDQRTNKTGEPTAAALPATINPLEFLVKNVLRNHAFVVKIKINQQGPFRLPLTSATKLDGIIPPHTALILIVELAAEEETITLSEAGDDETLGFSEDLISGDALEPIEETIDLTSFFTEEEPTIRYTDGVCL